jgi:hypothetical protein
MESETKTRPLRASPRLELAALDVVPPSSLAATAADWVPYLAACGRADSKATEQTPTYEDALRKGLHD